MGARNFIASIATVATGPRARREATMPAAMSIWLSTQPPKIWPLALMSPGPGTTRRIGSRAGSAIAMTSAGFVVIARAVADEQQPHQAGGDEDGEPDAGRGGDQHVDRHRLARALQ